MNLPRRLRQYWPVGLQVLAWELLIPSWYMLAWPFFTKTSTWLGRLSSLKMPLNDPMCYDSQYDFALFWSAGRMAHAHNYVSIYSPPTYLSWRLLHLCANATSLPWINLPPALLPSFAVSFLPFKLGLVVWLFVSMCGGIVLLRLANLSWVVVVAGLLSPAACLCFKTSQLGVIAGAAFVAVLMRSDDRPGLAGVVTGLLALKPQDALLAPFALLARKNWRAVVVAAGAVIFVLFCTILIFGVSAWQAYWQLGRHAAGLILFSSSKGYGLSSVSVFWMLRILGANIEVSLFFQFVSFLVSAGLVWYIWQRQDVSQIDRLALTVFLSLMATPYGYTHDMVGYSIALACLAERRRWRIDLLDVLFWLWPSFCAVVTVDTGVLLTPVVVGLAIGRTWLRAGLGFPVSFLRPSELAP